MPRTINLHMSRKKKKKKDIKFSRPFELFRGFLGPGMTVTTLAVMVKYRNNQFSRERKRNGEPTR